MITLVVGEAAAQVPVFRKAPTYRVSGSPSDALSILVAADIGSADEPFTPDGALDLITANQAARAAVLFGNNDGTFTAGPTTNISLIPTALAVGDFNNDGAKDLLVSDTRNVVFLRGRDDGTFAAPGPGVGAGRGPTAIAVDFLNDDQNLDAIVVNDGDGGNGGVTILLGRGDGTFGTPASTFPAGIASSGVALGDFSGDGQTDLAVTNAGSNDVNILLGEGGGSFTSGSRIGGLQEPVMIAAARLNADQRLDLVVVNRNADTVAVLDGLGGGGFSAPRAYRSGSAGSTPNSLAVADMNLDGHPDVLVSNNRSNDASVLLGDSNGNLGPPRAFVADLEPLAVLTEDFNQDELPDAMVLSRGDAGPTVAALLGIGDGSVFAVEDVVTEPGPTAVVTGDANNDGLTDLIVSHLPATQGASGPVLVYHADPRVGFAQPLVLQSTGDAVTVAAGDFNADGYLDAAAINRSTANVSVFLGRVTGGFSSAQDYAVGAGAVAAVAADWNRDGRTDLAVARQGSTPEGVDILLANADGSLRPPQFFAAGGNPVSIDYGDVNNDGLRDLVVANSESNDISVLIGNGDGTFRAPTSIPSANGPRAVAVGDFDRDGLDDLAVARSINSLVTVLYGNGQGGFVPGPQLAVRGSAAAVGARDVTGDSIPDVLIADQVSNVVLAYVSSGSTRQFSDDSLTVSRGPSSVAAGDVDGDGRYDVAAANSLVAGSVSVLTNVLATPVLRGDGNGDQRLTVADVLALVRELGDGRGRRIEAVQIAGGSYPASGGVDANGDGFVSGQDALASAHLLFAGI
jgi:hypothetical protein